MALYILNDQSITVQMPLKSQLEITMLRSLNRKRIKTKIIKDIDEIRIMQTDPEAVLVIQEMTEAAKNPIIFCNRHNIPVIVLHASNADTPHLLFNSVYGHPYENSRAIIRYLIHGGKRRLALFGFNNTVVDKNYAEAIYALLPSFSQQDFFQVTSDFEECFERFFAKRGNYDSVLFANDLIGIAFIDKISRLDPDYPNSRFLIGIADTLLSKLYHYPLTSLTYNQKSVKNSVSSAYRTILHNKGQIACINYLLPPEIFPRQSTQNLPLPNYNIVLPHISNNLKPRFKFEKYHYDYAEDPVLNRILLIENLLSSFDQEKFLLFYYIFIGKSNLEIAEALHINFRTLHYHTSQMYNSLGVSNKKEFSKILSPYISKENLYKFINASALMSTPPKNLTP